MAISGGIVTPFYDSLLVKVSASGRRFIDAARHMERALQEFRIRGVKTNIPFLLNVIDHPDFLDGKCTTRFIDLTPDLFKFALRQDRATRLLTFAAEVSRQRLLRAGDAAGRSPSSPRRARAAGQFDYDAGARPPGSSPAPASRLGRREVLGNGRASKSLCC